MYWDQMGDWGWGMMVFWAFLWVLIIGGAAWFMSEVARGHPPAQATRHRRSAREILDERLARGEVDPEEYARLHDVLKR